MLLAAAGPFSWLVAESQVGEFVVVTPSKVSDNPVVILFHHQRAAATGGDHLEPLPTMVIFLPALLPVAETLNIDPIHFGALVVVNLMIGLLTPPVGLLLFVVSSISNVPVTHIVREVWPHLLWSIIVLALLILFPPLSTWLPSQIRGSSRARRDP